MERHFLALSFTVHRPDHPHLFLSISPRFDTHSFVHSAGNADAGHVRGCLNYCREPKKKIRLKNCMSFDLKFGLKTICKTGIAEKHR